jgi:hypothetical protein
LFGNGLFGHVELWSDEKRPEYYALSEKVKSSFGRSRMTTKR